MSLSWNRPGSREQTPRTPRASPSQVIGVDITSLKTAYGGLGGGCSVVAKSCLRTDFPLRSASPIVPSGGIWRPTFHSGTPTTARQRSSVRSGS